MKKPLRYMLSVVLMLALMLSMGTAAFADKTDSGLPVEYVSYGVGLSDAPGVDKHGLGDDDITIDGVSWKTKTTEDALHVHVLDLAAAKLLRCCADGAKELGLDYAKLYIENGLIQVKEDVPAAEAEELKGKLDELTRAAVIGLVSGDAFDVGNGGEAKLQVKIAGFATVAQETETAKSGLDVKGIGMPVKDVEYGEKGSITAEFDKSAAENKNFAEVTTTTIYIAYGGVTEYYYDYYDVRPNTLNDEESYQERLPSRKDREGYVGVAKAADDENDYYIKVIGIDDEPEFIRVGDLASEGIKDSTILEIVGSNEKLATKIIVATDKDGNNVVMTINLIDGTPKLEEIPGYEPRLPEYGPDEDETEQPEGDDGDISLSDAALGEDGNEEPEEGSAEGGANRAPEGYYEVSSNGSHYDPDEIISVGPGEDTVDVIVRDTVLVPALIS